MSRHRIDCDGARRRSKTGAALRPGAFWNSAAITPRWWRRRADLDLTLRGVAFAAMGTAGQRCTTLRRLFVHESVYASCCRALKARLSIRFSGRPARCQNAGRPADRSVALTRRCNVRWTRRKRWAAPLLAENASPSKERTTGTMFARHCRNRRTERPRRTGDLRADLLCHKIRRFRSHDRNAQRCAAGPVILDFHQ